MDDTSSRCFVLRSASPGIDSGQDTRDGKDELENGFTKRPVLFRIHLFGICAHHGRPLVPGTPTRVLACRIMLFLAFSSSRLARTCWFPSFPAVFWRCRRQGAAGTQRERLEAVGSRVRWLLFYMMDVLCCLFASLIKQLLEFG